MPAGSPDDLNVAELTGLHHREAVEAVEGVGTLA
jgi:hypothetical protein